MQRIDHATRALNLFGTGKDGFTGGSPSTQVAPTTVTPGFLNNLQEELANASEAFETLEPQNHYQLLCAIRQEGDFAGLQTLVEALMTSSYAYDAASGANGTIVVVCTATNFIYSAPDGFSFAPRAMGGGSTNALRAVASSYNSFCAVGVAGEIQTSPDGTTWTKRTPAGAYAGTFSSVARLGALWIAVGTADEIQTSPDGITWTKRTSPNFQHYGSVAVEGPAAVIGGNAGANYAICRSLDGITWTTVASGVGAYQYASAVPGGFIAVNGGAITAAVRSFDHGLTWQAIAASSNGSSDPVRFSRYSGLMTMTGLSRLGEGWDVKRTPAGGSTPVIAMTSPTYQGLWLKRTQFAWVGFDATNRLWVSRLLPGCF